MLSSINGFVQTNYPTLVSKGFGFISATASLECAIRVINDLKTIYDGECGFRYLKNQMAFNFVNCIAYGLCAARIFPLSEVIGTIIYLFHSIINSKLNDENQYKEENYPSTYIGGFILSYITEVKSIVTILKKSYG